MVINIYIIYMVLVWSVFCGKIRVDTYIQLIPNMDAIWLLDKKPRTETRQLPSVRKGIAMGIFSATEGSPIRLDLRGGGDLHP